MSDITPWQALPPPAEADYSQRIADSANEELHLSDFWKIVVKRYRLVLVVFGAILGIGAYISLSATRMYTASSSLRIEPQNPTVVGVAQVLPSEAAGGGAYDYYQTQFILLRSRDLAAKVISDLGLGSNPLFTSTRIVSSDLKSRLRSWALSPFRLLTQLLQPARRTSDTGKSPNRQLESSAGTEAGKISIDPSLVDRYLSFLSVEPVLKTRLVEVTMTTPDAGLSQQLANAHVATFIHTNLAIQFSITNEAREFLDKKNTELKAKLEQSEAELNRFRQRYGVVSLDKGENVVVDRLMELNRQLTLARGDRIQAEALYRTIQNKNPQNLVEVINNSLITSIKGTLAGLESERARLSITYKAEHPRLAELIQQIAEVRRSLNQEIANITRGIESSYNTARAREEALQREASKQQTIALDLKEVGVQYAVLQEEVNVNRTLYESVLKRLSETQVSNDIPVSNMRIAETAELPRFPSAPQTERNLLFTAALGIFLGVGLAFCLEYFDSSVGTPAMVWRVAAKPTLGVVPKLDSLSAPESSGRRLLEGLSRAVPMSRWLSSRSSVRVVPVVGQHPASIVADSFRTIRTALLLSRAEKPPQVILLTSAAPSEGKTVTTLNLAIALAQGGKSVLVIDADLRRGRCHELTGVANHRGLTEVLTSNVPWQESIQRSAVDGLSLLSRGAVPPYPPDLLASTKMGDVLDELRQAFEFILIDSPPVIPVTDALVVSGYCDGAVLVVHAQNSTVASTRQAMERLQVVRASVLGVVLNGIDTRNPEYAYYSYYTSYEASDVADKPQSGADKTVERTPENPPSKTELPAYDASAMADGPQNGGVKIIERAPEDQATKTEPDDHDSSAPAHRPPNGRSKTIEPLPEDRSSGTELASSAVAEKPQNGGSKTMEPAPKERPSETHLASYETSAPDKPQNGGSRTEHRASKEQPSKIKLVPAKQKPEHVPQDFFDHMVFMLCEAAGPMAPIIVDDHIHSLGESREAFPKHRLGELFDRVCEEILDAKMRTHFRRTLQGELRAL